VLGTSDGKYDRGKPSNRSNAEHTVHVARELFGLSAEDSLCHSRLPSRFVILSDLDQN
jgi:hypothetical protein